jgi:hypothetical protein
VISIMPAQELPPPIDTDKDGISDLKDNCPRVPNPGQRDMDENGKWDLCDKVVSSEAVIQ